MILLNLTIQCSQTSCKETIDIQIDWEDVSIDLNSRKIKLPVDQLWEHDWYCGDRYTSSYDSSEQEEYHHCPKCSEEIRKRKQRS